MEENSVPQFEPIENLLAGIARATPDPQFRLALLRQTTRVLRRRRFMKRLVYGTGLAACYMAGLLTMKWAMSPEPAPSTQQAVVQPDEKSAGMPLVQNSVPKPRETAVALEWKALESQEKAEAYRIAGDRYLQETGDIQSAVRCYRQYLEAGSEEGLMISPNDNWLLMALKEAKQKEMRYAKLGG
jgi:hypothetical protein